MLAAEQLVERCYKRGVLIFITHDLVPLMSKMLFMRRAAYSSKLKVVGLSHVKAKPSEPHVTNAVGGTVFHHFGFAIVFVLIEFGYDMCTDSDRDGMADWSEVVEDANDLGFGCGNWTLFVDNPLFISRLVCPVRSIGLASNLTQ